MKTKSTPWSQAEDQVLISMYQRSNGREIGLLLKRSPKSVYSRAHRLGIAKHPVKKRGACEKPTKPVFYANAGVSYKEALPSHKWPGLEHFLILLISYHQRARDIQKNSSRIYEYPDISSFMEVYKDIFTQKKHEFSSQDGSQEVG